MEDREAKRMKIGFRHIIEFPEEICVDIMARLPFRSVMRFKAVCRRWREVIKTEYFRHKFMFAHRNSSSSWSIMHGTFGNSSGEVVGFYGCERYGLPRSLDSYIPPHEPGDKNMIIACSDGLVLLQTIWSSGQETYSVGNPVLNQWVQLPPLPSKAFNPWVKASGLVTRVEDGVVVEYKVVFINDDLGFHGVETLRFDICSSKTGIWISKQIRCPHLVYSLNYERCLSLNEKLHWLDKYGSGSLVAYDFFAVDEQQQQCQVIPFPDSETCCRRAYTTSGGFIVYINKIHLHLRLWRLEEYTSDSGRWELMQDINLTSFGSDHHCVPMAMHPFETHIIYMSTWKSGFVSIDLKTHKLTPHTKSSTYSDTMLFQYLEDVYLSFSNGHEYDVFYTPQYILPQWMGSVPTLPSGSFFSYCG